MKEFEDGLTPKSTTKCTKWSVKIYEKYARSSNNQYLTLDDLKNLQPATLNEVLREFYFLMRTEDGNFYKPVSLRSVRAGIRRALLASLQPYPHDIIESQHFITSNKMLETMAKKYMTEPTATKTQHKPSITEEDLVKIGIFAETAARNPTTLLYLVWFYLAYYYGQRGCEKWPEYKVSDLEFSEDSKGKFVVLSKTRMIQSKTHQGGLTSSSLDDSIMPHIYEDPTDPVDPYKTFHLYIQKIDLEEGEDCRLFLTPNTKTQMNPSSVWYHKKKPMGINKISQILPEISKLADLSQRYTNQSVRATTITQLRRMGNSREKVKMITKHKSTEIMTVYEDQILLEQYLKCTDY